MDRKGWNKRRKAGMAVGIFLLLLLGTGFWAGRGAAGSGQEFRMWTAADRQLNVVIDGEVLRVAGKGLNPENGVMWVRVVDGDGVRQEEFCRGKDGHYTVSLPLVRSMEKGRTYYVEVYLGQEEYGEYRGLLFREAPFRLSKGGGKHGSFTFPDSEIYRENKKWLEGEQPPESGGDERTSRHRKWKPEFRSLAMTICAGRKTEEQKALAIHDWVTSQICYDEDEAQTEKATEDGARTMAVSENGQSARAVLEKGRAVCEGYARLVAELSRAAGLPCKIIYGRGSNPAAANEGSADGAAGADQAERTGESPGESGEERPNHAWNEIWVNGRWVIVDATWDADGVYRDGFYLRNGSRGRTYFDISPEAFAATHRIMGDLEELENTKPNR